MPDLDDRIRRREAELARLRAHVQLIATIRVTIGPGVAFSSVELWQHQILSADLRTVFKEAGISNPRQLGKTLRQLCGCGLTRLGEDRAGVLWCVEL